MTKDYNAKLLEDYEEIRGKVERGMLPLVARIPAIDKAVSEYVIAREEHLANKRNPPIAYRDEKALERFADLVLYEELKWSHPDKMTIVEYPVMSDWQEIERNSKRVLPGEITFRDRNHNGRRKAHSVGKNGEIKVTNPKMPDAEDREIRNVGNMIDIHTLIERAKLTDRQRQAVELVYFDDKTQEQAGEIMGVRKHTVNEHLTIALRKLREKTELISE